MSDVFELQSQRPGIRLHRLELFNWGTFDSADGSVFIANPEGRTALLVGRNGAGKSTLVDALLTLLVPSTIRNYNVAAGAKKKERTEKTYVLGACDQQLGDDGGNVSKRYLRGDGKHYTVLLAYFYDENIDSGFTIAQVLYARSDSSIEKIYLFAEGNRTIETDLNGLTKSEGLITTLKARGFQATKTFTEYHGWFVRRAGLKQLAMDMFNQTVAVKDIRSLNQFIRAHMLEPSGGRERVQKLVQHFSELRAAHRQLVRVRVQHDLLLPIEKFGNQYNQFNGELVAAQKLALAADPFFRQKIIELAKPELARLNQVLETRESKRDTLKQQIADANDQARKLKNEIDMAGGDRLRQIPMLIELEQTRLRQKQSKRQGLIDSLSACGRDDKIDNADQLAGVIDSLKVRRDEINALTRQQNELRDDLVVRRASLTRSQKEHVDELEMLKRRRTNLPGSFARLRAMICQDLRMREDQLVFASELIAVSEDQQPWESSIEMVLRSFALSLLVPDKYYRQVSKYIEQTRLVDGKSDRRARGQKLVYLRVASEVDNAATRDRLHDQSLVRKLRFRDGHTLVPWVTQQVETRFDYRCCESIEEFHEAPRLAITKNRHAKFGSSRHEKDDRNKMADASQYVLGWDNQAKKRRLAEAIDALQIQINELNSQVQACESQIATLAREAAAIDRCFQVRTFDEIDTQTHIAAVAALEAERKALESNNDKVRVLKDRLAEVEKQADTLGSQRDEIVQQIGTLKREIESGKKLVNVAESKLAKMKSDGRLERATAMFDQIQQALGDPPLSFDDMFDREEKFKEKQQAAIFRLRAVLEPIESKLTKAMGDFFKKCQEERDDLDASVQSLPSFLAKLDAIRREDLPRHESRFKDRLNDTVTKEIGVFHSELQAEGRQIQSKIDELNEALRELPYNDGTFMRLDVRPVKNPEINDFRQSLRSCLDDSFDDTEASREARFKRIETLISRLSEESTWRDRVIDVRRWYDFGACEIDAESGDTRSYYEDSSGQSGGEKARLAFTILVAAIVYQYDLDLSGNDTGGFHFVVVDEMFSKIDDRFASYALKLFERFGLQLIIVAPLDAKARVTEPYVQYYLQILKNDKTYQSQLVTMTAREYEAVIAKASKAKTSSKKKAKVIKQDTPLFQ